MRVLVVHNAYQHRGGEDTVAEAEVALLRAHGHEVQTYLRSNDDINSLSRLGVARQTLWSDRTSRDVAARVASFRPEVIHAHNTFPLVSPSLYWAADRLRVPVVQTLHNFRLMCLNGLYLRDGQVCEDCTGSLPWRGVVRGCYRESRAASAVLAGTLTLHRSIGTYRHKVARYIALNEFCRRKFIEGGLPADRVVVKPNFVDAAEPVSGARTGFLFVGRLSQEKGIDCLASALLSEPALRLRVAGDGPAASRLEGLPNAERLGRLSQDEVRGEMSRARALVVPSIWYETFGLVVLEAFASCCPVIASRIGSLAELVVDGHNGLLFDPGDPLDLAQKMQWASAHQAEMTAMGRRAREDFERHFSPQANHQRLMEIYEETLRECA